MGSRGSQGSNVIAATAVKLARASSSAVEERDRVIESSRLVCELLYRV